MSMFFFRTHLAWIYSHSLGSMNEIFERASWLSKDICDHSTWLAAWPLLDVHKFRKFLDFAWKGALCFEPGIEVLLLIVQESGCVFP